MGATLQNNLNSLTANIRPKEVDRVGDAAGGSIYEKLATILEEDSEELIFATQEKKARKSKVVDSIKINIITNLEQVSLVLACKKRPIASLAIKHFNAGVILKSSYTEVNLCLEDIVMMDLNPKNIHSNILSIVGNNALYCQVIFYNLDETSNYNSDDMKITVEIGCMKIVFINWFVTSVLSFLNNFQAAQNAIAQASAAAADAAKQNAMDAYQKATRMKLDIRVKAPIIVVPRDSKSSKAVVLDLGLLNLTNSTTEVNISDQKSSPAIIDEIKLELREMKLSKVTLSDADESRVSIATTINSSDSDFGMRSKTNILDPISCTLNVKRNLSSSWYKEAPEIDLSGRLKTIELNLVMDDYALIMSILHRNLSEGVDEFPTIGTKVTTGPRQTTEPPRQTVGRKTSFSPMRNSKNVMQAKDVVKIKIYEQLRFNFQFDGVIANLMLDDYEGLARFGLYFLSVRGKKLIDGTLSTSIVLCDVQIDDMRSNTKSQITKYLCRKDWKSNKSKQPLPTNAIDVVDICNKDLNYMVDITAILKENETYAEIRVCGFDLIFCIDFLLKISYFVTLPEDKEKASIQKVVEQKGRESQQIQRLSNKIDASPSKNTVDNKINLTLYIEEPDIILIESLEDMNTNAIIFNAQGQLNYRVVGEKQIINGQIDSLKMYMCAFNPEKRDATKHYIIHPCVISLQGSTPEEEGLHLSLKLSEIIINVSPATIELFNKAMNTINVGSTEKAINLKVDEDFKDIWEVAQFNEDDYWFVKVDQAEDALDISCMDENIVENKVRTEKCVIEIPCITIVVEHGVGYYTTPLISIDTRINTIVSNWSRNLNVNGSLSLSMNYYNQTLAEWEPIIEMNEHFNRSGKSEYIPWQLNFIVDIKSTKSELDEEVLQSTTNIKIHSEENLEITMSKTCLDLLGVLSQAFSQAIDSKGLTKPDVIAPFVIENDTGFEIKVNFQKGIFTLHECHMPRTSLSYNINHSLVFLSEETVLSDDIKECTISPGGRVYLQTKDLSAISNEEEEEYNIHVKISDIEKEVVLPVTRSDQRYFPLYKDTNQEPWGIVSEVRSEYGTTKINLHGVVSLRNHFTTTVLIYQNKSNDLQDKILIGEVAAGATYHLPLYTIYADKKELYFTVEGYNVSIQGIKWNDTPSDLAYTRQLQCDPINTFEPFYINIIRQKTEIYFEATNKYKLLSAFYTIHLKPPLYLRNALPISIKVSVAGCSVRQNAIKTNDIVDAFMANLPKRPNKEDMLDYGEKEVQPGDVLHLPTVKFSGKNKEGMSFLVIRLMQYLEKDWSCTTEISEQKEQDEILGTWTFSSYDSVAKMDIELFVRYENRSGSFMVTLFSPFWMINKTGLMLSYKTDSETMDVLYHPPEYKGPILFSFREKYFFDKKSASIRIDNGEWGDRIPLDVAGSIGSVTCKANDMSYQIGVHNHLTHNSLTKKITFIPFFVATNKCVFPIELQEQTRPGDAWIKVAPNACVPLWPKTDTNHMIIARVQDQHTVPFKYSDVQCTLLKLEHNRYGGINVDVQSTEGGVYITFSEYNQGDAPGIIINHTSKAIMYYEKGDKTEHVLNPHNKIFYTWKKPAGDKIIVFGKDHVETDLKRDGLGELVLSTRRKAFWVSFLDGLQRVLLFTDDETIASKLENSSIFQKVAQSIEIKIHGIGFSILNNVSGVDIMYLGITSSGVIWESKKENKKRYKQMKIHDTELIEAQYQQYLLDKSVGKQNQYLLDAKNKIDFEQMLLEKNAIRIIRRTFYPGVWINIKTSPYQMQIHAKINKIQLDNQLSDCIFPVVLAPIAPPKSVATTTTLKPFVECSIVQRVVPNSNVKQYKYARMLIQEFHFKVDILFLTAIANMFTVEVNDQQAAKLFNEDVDSIETPFSELIETHSRLEQKNFYDNLHLGPLKIHVSFSMAGSDTTALPGILSTVVQGVGVTLTDVNDVVFRLAFFNREYQFFTQRQLTTEITSHYTGQALKQLYVLVLGLDVLGNPYGLVVGLKKGVEDLFYEPFQGAIQGPGEFAEGLVLGVKSLFGHTVGGAAGAVSKITGAMGKGLAALTFDDDYQKKRRQAMNRRPANFHEGIARSGKGLVMGFVDGVTGVVTKPVAGAREEGVEGFFKGLGKGAIGLVARPTAGVVDFASGSLEAVKRATESGDEAQRLRPSRFLHQDNILRPYCLSEAKGNQLLKLIDKGKYANTDTFVHCEEIIQKQEFVIISNHRVIYAARNDLFGTWAVQWTYLWHDIASVSPTQRGVEIKLKILGKKVMGLFSSNETQRKVILMQNQAKRELLAEILESHRKDI